MLNDIIVICNFFPSEYGHHCGQQTTWNANVSRCR